MADYKNKTLNALLDSYEKSKLFTGSNAVKQTIWKKPSDIERKYTDESEYEIYRTYNLALEELEGIDYVSCKRKRNGEVTRIDLNCERLPEIYAAISRVPKKETNSELLEILRLYCDDNPILNKYCTEQINNIANNKSVKLFDGDMKAFKDTLIAVSAITHVEKETYERDFSMDLFRDSKRFEAIRSKVKSLLINYSDVPEPETVLEDLNVIKNPGYIYFKGNGKLTISGETINFSKLSHGIAISSAMIGDISSIEVLGNNVMTIENLTTFNVFKDSDTVCIYLGGFHNTARRQFIKKLYEQNPCKNYYHYGDIDAGGFYILLHLRGKTGVPFKPFAMNVRTLKESEHYLKPLTANDRTRLKNLLDTEFHEVIEYMLKNNCKLEQEALD